MKTVNRGWLKRQVQTGNIEAKLIFDIHDDSRLDRGEMFDGVERWIPCRIKESMGWEDWKEGYINFIDWHFSTKSGTAYKDKNGVITLVIHSNLVYELRQITA